MRAIFIKQATDWTALGGKLVTGGDPAQALATLQRLNPHLDFAHIPNGAVVLVPDQPSSFRTDESQSVVGDAFAALQAQLNDAVASTVADVRSGVADRLAMQKDVTAALKSAAVKRLIESDPDLAKQAEAALAAAKEDATQAKETESAMQTLQKEAAAELAVLAKLLG